MAVCNIFSELTKETGTFLTFSQYMEDLTKHNSNNEYKVIPSKFIALKLNVSEYTNNTLPGFFQNNFENGCAVVKNSTDIDWDYDKFRNLFWQSLIDGGIISIQNNICPEIKYMGDINISSYDVIDGMGYSEIYCHIPNEAKQQSYKLEISEEYYTLQSNSYIEGYDNEEEYKLDNIISYRIPNSMMKIDSSDNVINSPSFTFNAILVLYKTVNGDIQLSDDIPMGIFITGLISEGSIDNYITKYVDSDNSTGTSYGLRICSRFATSLSNNVQLSVIGNSDYHSDMSRVLEEMSKTQKKMDDIINKTYSDSQNYKDLLAIFKNSKTNVPYIKNINGINYWFVNGKMLNKATSETTDHNCYDLITNMENGIILLNDVQKEQVINNNINWSIKSGDVDIKPSKLEVNDGNGQIQVPVESPIKVDFKITDIEPLIKEYDIIAKICTATGEEQITEKCRVSLVWPSYCGLVNTENQIFNTEFVKLDSKHHQITYTNNDSEHICFAYPQSFGLLTSIKDSRDMEYLLDFDRKEYNHTYGATEVPYYIYIDKHPAKVENYTLKFS